MKLIDLFKNKRGKNMALYILIGIIFLLLVYFLVTYNSLVKSNNIVKEAFSTMDVYLKKRWDLIPNLVEIVKEYTKYEQSTLMQITNLRTDAYENMTMNKKININEQLTQEVSKIMLISENYPELKASENFLQLSRDLTYVEDEIANSRKYYNGSVRILNTKIQVFPSNIVARMFGFKPANMFIANAEEKNNVKVDL
ncbi:lemA family protein [Clostridium sp. CAG:575]|nr:lemA family protein [Clostridium sp. CAG:575]